MLDNSQHRIRCAIGATIGHAPYFRVFTLINESEFVKIGIIAPSLDGDNFDFYEQFGNDEGRDAKTG